MQTPHLFHFDQFVRIYQFRQNEFYQNAEFIYAYFPQIYCQIMDCKLIKQIAWRLTRVRRYSPSLIPDLLSANLD